MGATRWRCRVAAERGDELLDGFAVCLAQAMRRTGKHLAGEAGCLVKQPLELVLGDDNQPHVGVRDDCRIAGRVYEEREFPERASRSESGDLAALAADADGAVED